MTLMLLGISRQSVAQMMALKSNILYDATSTINLGYEVGLNRKMTLDIWVNYNPWTLGSKWVGLYERELIQVPDGYRASAQQRTSKLKHLAIQPEIRFWPCEKFNGHFFGIHTHGGIYNIGALKLPFNFGRNKDAQGNFLGTYPVTMMPADHSALTVSGVAYHPWRGNTQVTDNDTYWRNADNDGIYINSYEGWFVGAGVSYGYHMIIAPRFSIEVTVGAGYTYFRYDKNRCTDCKKKIGEGESHYIGPDRAGITAVIMLK